MALSKLIKGQRPATMLDGGTAMDEVQLAEAEMEVLKKRGKKGKFVYDAYQASKPMVAPIPDDERLQALKQRALQRRYANAGRAGTMLTSQGGTLG